MKYINTCILGIMAILLLCNLVEMIGIKSQNRRLCQTMKASQCFDHSSSHLDILRDEVYGVSEELSKIHDDLILFKGECLDAERDLLGAVENRLADNWTGRWKKVRVGGGGGGESRKLFQN